MRKITKVINLRALLMGATLLLVAGGLLHAQTQVDTALQTTASGWLPVLSALPWWSKVAGVIGIVSEALAFLPVPANGVLHGLVLGLKAIVSGLSKPPAK